MADPIDWELVDRYFAGELDEVHAASVRRWLMAHPEEHQMLSALGYTLDGQSAAHTLGPVTHADVQRSWRHVAERMRAAGTGEHNGSVPHRGQRNPSSAPSASDTRARPPFRAASRGRPWMTGAVAAVLVSAMAWLLVIRVGSESMATPAHVYATHNHQHRSVTLADGSTVLLGDASTLTVPANFGRATRTVTVHGDAYITVTHHTRSPFIVRAGRATARVLGTSFMVQTNGAGAMVRVVVADGRVAFGAVDSTRVGRNAAEAVLPARTMGELSDSGRIAITPNIVLDDALDWTQGRLVFRNTPIRDALPRLERRYDVTIRVADTVLVNETLTSTFANEPLTQVLDVLALTFHATYTRSGPSGRVITFTPSRLPVRQTTPTRSAPSFASEVSYGK